MPSVVIRDACGDIGLRIGVTPEILFVIKTDSQVTLTQLRNESVTTRSRPFANRFNYAHDMCHGTTLHPASVRAVFEPGKSQKADGLTKCLAGALLKSVTIAVAFLSSHHFGTKLVDGSSPRADQH